MFGHLLPGIDCMDERIALLTSLSTYMQAGATIAAQRMNHDAVVAESGRVLAEYNALQDECMALLSTLDNRQQQLASTSKQLELEITAHAADNARLMAELQLLQVLPLMIPLSLFARRPCAEIKIANGQR